METHEGPRAAVHSLRGVGAATLSWAYKSAGVLLKCQLRLGRSGVGPGILHLTGDAYPAGPQTTL